MSNSKTFGFNKRAKKAFTLVELSIVLIIIGLLIVAITSGSSLIRNAKLRSIMNEAKQYQVAVNSFFMKFDEYPGDFDQQIGANSRAGNNDDIIQWASGVAGETIESSNAWLHLMDSGILPSDTISNATLDVAAGNPVRGEDFPESAEDAAGWMFGSGGTDDGADNTAGTAQTNRVFLLGDTANFPAAGTDVDAPTYATTGLATGVLTTADAYSIDKKNDDATAVTGDIRGTGLAANADNCITTYNLVTTTDNICGLSFKVSIN